MKTTTKVIEVREVPQLKKPAIQQGIRDKAAAQNWGEKHGYSTVYFMARKQKVYAEKPQVKVDERAKKIEQDSGPVLEQMEMAL